MIAHETNSVIRLNAVIAGELILIIGGLLIIPDHQSKENNMAQIVKEDPVINFAEPEENEDGMAYGIKKRHGL